MKKALLSILIICSASATGCVHTGYIAPAPAPESEMVKALLLEQLNPYPKEFKASQHIVLNLNGKEYDFLGYLAVNGEGFRALALGEMGGKVFDLVSRRGRVELLTEPGHFPSMPLLEGVAGDIAHLYLRRDGNDAYPAREPDNRLSLVMRQGERMAEYIFAADGRCIASMEAADGKVVRRVEYTDYRLFPGWERPLPSRIVLHNLRWRYEMKIELLKIDAGPVDRQMIFRLTGEN